MKKYCLDLTVKSVEHINEKYVLLKLTDENPLPEMIPGQFVEIQVDGSKTTFLRRPISINDVDREDNTLHLLIACIGDGTRQLGTLTVGAKVNIVLPLGNGFTMPASPEKKHLLVGGGVGVAPLLFSCSVRVARRICLCSMNTGKSDVCSSLQKMALKERKAL